MNRIRTAVGIVALFAVAALGVASARAGDEIAAPDAAQVERGKYLVTFGGCHDCHTPAKMGENGPEPDMDRMLSGHPQDVVVTEPAPLGDGPWMAAGSVTFTAWSGPWGVSFTRNLTPDDETGIGTWTEQEFIATLRNGRSRGIGRETLPPMPWPGIGQATDEDLAAIFAYLRTIPAVSNRVPDPLPPAGEGGQ